MRINSASVNWSASATRSSSSAVWYAFNVSVDHLADVSPFTTIILPATIASATTTPQQKSMLHVEGFPLRWRVRNVPTGFLMPVTDGNTVCVKMQT
jgi:hypothetical protein